MAIKPSRPLLVPCVGIRPSRHSLRSMCIQNEHVIRPSDVHTSCLSYSPTTSYTERCWLEYLHTDYSDEFQVCPEDDPESSESMEDCMFDSDFFNEEHSE